MKCVYFRYKLNVSTTNMILHLNGLQHKFDVKSRTEDAKLTALDNWFSGNPMRREKSNNTNSPVSRLARDLTLWVARDLCPFSIVDKDGFQEFCKKYSIIKPGENLPHRTTLSRSALTDVFNWVKNKMKLLINGSGKTVGLTFDCWTDN